MAKIILHQQKNICGNLCSSCPYLPDMSLKDEDWYIDDDGVKLRKKHKPYKCLYDLHDLDWNIVCPRTIKE